jgi:hypothetical protein
VYSELPDEMSSTETQASATAEFKTPWRTIALWSIGITVVGVVGSLTALVLVATEHRANGLATIALALAVTAFVIQILVFVAQLFASGQQTARNEETYARLNGLLEGLRGTTQGTQETLTRYMGALLKAATGVATEALEEESEGTTRVDPAELEQRIAERAREAISTRGVDIALQPTNIDPPPKLSPEDQEILRLLDTYPSEDEGKEGYETLTELSPLAVEELRRYGDNERRRRSIGQTPGLRKMPTATWTNELEEKGLVARCGPPEAEGTQPVRLTSEGLQVARLLTARTSSPGAPPPEWLRRASVRRPDG